MVAWLKVQDEASRAKSGTPHLATQTARGVRAGTSVEEDTSTPGKQTTPIHGGRKLLKSWTSNFTGLLRAKQEYKKTAPEADQDFKMIEPQQLSPWTESHSRTAKTVEISPYQLDDPSGSNLVSGMC